MVIRSLRLQRNEGIIEGNCVSLPDLIMRFMQTLNELGSKGGEVGRFFKRLTRQSSMRLITYGKKFVGVAHTYVKHLITMQSLRDRASFPLVSKLRSL